MTTSNVTHVFRVTLLLIPFLPEMDVPVSSGGGQDYEMNISDDKILKPYGEIFGMNFLSR